MHKTWFSYVVLSIGLMMFVASDKTVTADDKESHHTVSFGGDQKFEIMVNRDGNENPSVEMIVNGEKHSFTMPELQEGQDTILTTEDGKQITLKARSSGNIVFLDGKELKLPHLNKHKINTEGLSAMISRTHQLKIDNDITVSGHNLSDDVRAAIKEAINGVLVSYDVDRKVRFTPNHIHPISSSFIPANGQALEFKIDTDVNMDLHPESKMMIIEAIEKSVESKDSDN